MSVPFSYRDRPTLTPDEARMAYRTAFAAAVEGVGISARELAWSPYLLDTDRAWLRKHLALADGRTA